MFFVSFDHAQDVIYYRVRLFIANEMVCNIETAKKIVIWNAMLSQKTLKCLLACCIRMEETTLT